MVNCVEFECSDRQWKTFNYDKSLIKYKVFFYHIILLTIAFESILTAHLQLQNSENRSMPSWYKLLPR